MLLFLAFAVAAASDAPIPVAPAVRQDHYFVSDAHESAGYLHLGADGRYVVVHVQHMFTDVDDVGGWRVAGRRFVLESDRSVRDIDLDEFKVFVFDRCGQETLPELRARIFELQDGGGLVAPDVLESLDITRRNHPLGRGPGKLCGASLSYSPKTYPAMPVPAERLGAVIAGIDAWTAEEATQHVFEYEAWEYRGERFLVPQKSGMHAAQLSVEHVRRDMDRNDGERATYAYYAISAEEHAKGTNCTYAFKFATQMNAPCNED